MGGWSTARRDAGNEHEYPDINAIACHRAIDPAVKMVGAERHRRGADGRLEGRP
jgi:hypothetical protein